MNMDHFKPLQDYLDSLPEPKWWQFRTRFIIWLSNRIDEHKMKKAGQKMKDKRFSQM